MGIADLEKVRRETGIRESRGDLIALAVSPSFPGVVYTTPEMVALERKNLELMRGGKGRAQAITTEQYARSWAAARSRESNRPRRDFGTRTRTRSLAGDFSGRDRGSGRIQRSSQHRTRSRY